MSGQIKVNGNVIGGPAVVSTGTFPSARFDAIIALRDGSKSFNAATGILSYNVASPGPAYQTLDGVGAARTVVKGNFLYFRTSSQIQLRLTTDDGIGGSVLSILPVYGLLVVEFDDSKFLKLLEAQGSGMVEYLVSGS